MRIDRPVHRVGPSSLGLTIPMDFVEAFDLKVGDTVGVVLHRKRVVLDDERSE